MPTEYIVVDTVVASLTIRDSSNQGGGANDPPYADLSQRLRAVCQPPREVPIFLQGRAHSPVFANSNGLATGCSWTDSGDGGGVGQVVLAPVDQPDARIRVGVKLAVAKDGEMAWLTTEHNPTSMRLGHNIHPAAFSDPETGIEVAYPSSNWNAMSHAYGLGLESVEEMAGGNLFDEETRATIERGEIHLVRVQWAATKAVKSAPEFLQLLTVVYDPTIARGSGIISNATHLGLEFDPYIDPETHHVTGVLFRKLHGRKPVFSVSVYDKQVSLERMHQTLELLTEAQAATVKKSMREDITAHSEGIIFIAKKAQEKLRSWGEEGLEFVDFIAPAEFLSEEPKPTIWWLKRAVYILSHYRHRGECQRFSFGVWLVPYIEEDVLHFDVVAGITADGLHRMLGVCDPVAEAWRRDGVETGEGWAGRLAKEAKCSPATVYNRRDHWRDKFGINIAYPPQLYSDVLHFGQASTARPENVAKMLTAVKAENGDALLQLYTEALADFEHKRVTTLNPALLARPRAMPLEGPPSGPPELDDGIEDLFLEEDDLLDEEAPVLAAQAPRALILAKTTPSEAKVKATSKQPPPGLPKPTRNPWAGRKPSSRSAAQREGRLLTRKTD